MTLELGLRVRLSDAVPWPERRGATGMIVAPPRDGTYPQPTPWERLILLDRDPLTKAGAPRWSVGVLWSCVVEAKDLLPEVRG